MTRIRGLFESHLPVGNLERSIVFYRDVLGLRHAGEFEERRAAFFWTGAPGQSMLGLWELHVEPIRIGWRPELHVAFAVTLEELLDAPAELRAAGVEPLNFDGKPTNEPDVLAWMPAAAVYFEDPDGNLLEYLAMLDEPARPELGVVPWSEWL